MQQHKPTPRSVFSKRQAGAARAQVTPEEQEMHKIAKVQYPKLALSPGEYVLSEVRRHPIGIITIWAVTIFLVVVALGLVPIYAASMSSVSTALVVPVQNLPTAVTMAVPALILSAFFLLGGFIATYVYQQNRFYITTESIVQFVQYSLFNSKQQVVNLINVEDVSADQTGIIQQVLNYGTLRLSTQGQETIYHFRFVAKPSDVVHHINDATELAIQRLEGTGYPPTELAG